MTFFRVSGWLNLYKFLFGESKGHFEEAGLWLRRILTWSCHSTSFLKNAGSDFYGYLLPNSRWKLPMSHDHRRSNCPKSNKSPPGIQYCDGGGMFRPAKQEMRLRSHGAWNPLELPQSWLNGNSGVPIFFEGPGCLGLPTRSLTASFLLVKLHPKSWLQDILQWYI